MKMLTGPDPYVPGEEVVLEWAGPPDWEVDLSFLVPVSMLAYQVRADPQADWHKVDCYNFEHCWQVVGRTPDGRVTLCLSSFCEAPVVVTLRKSWRETLGATSIVLRPLGGGRLTCVRTYWAENPLAELGKADEMPAWLDRGHFAYKTWDDPAEEPVVVTMSPDGRTLLQFDLAGKEVPGSAMPLMEPGADDGTLCGGRVWCGPQGITAITYRRGPSAFTEKDRQVRVYAWGSPGGASHTCTPIEPGRGVTGQLDCTGRAYRILTDDGPDRSCRVWEEVAGLAPAPPGLWWPEEAGPSAERRTVDGAVENVRAATSASPKFRMRLALLRTGDWLAYTAEVRQGPYCRGSSQPRFCVMRPAV